MANLFNNGQATQGNPILQQIMRNPRAYVGQLKADPAGFLKRLGVNIPDGVNTADPMQIIQALFGAPPQGMKR